MAIHKTAGKASIKDIAELAGVSVGTVSRVMNHKPDVGPETVARVMEAVKKLDYKPNPIAANLARKHDLKNLNAVKFKAGALGFLSASQDMGVYLHDEFQSRYLSGIEAVAGVRNLDLLFSSCLEQMSSGQMPKMVVKGQIDGAIIKDLGKMPDDWLESLASVIPVVLLSGRYESPTRTISSVMGDNAAAIRKILLYLQGLGHKRIGFLNINDKGTAMGYDHRQRRNAYIEGVRELALPCVEGFLQEPERDHAIQSLDDAISIALDAWLAMGPGRPTAICCATDVYAMSLCKLARAKGLALPEDLSVTGFMDIHGAALNDPPLTTMSLPSGEMGRAAASLLIEHIENPDMAPRNVLVDCPLIERLSCSRV